MRHLTLRNDPRGRRTEKRVIRWEDEDGDSIPDPEEEQPPRVTRYLYDGDNILATFTDTGRERARYTPGPGIDEPLAELHRKQLTFYHADVLGSIIGLTDAQGQPLRAYHYQAFGLPEEYRADRQPFRFTGREWDKESGLYYYRARYYDPRVGRFTQEDPIGLTGGVNTFRYVGNGPTTFKDPFGLLNLLAGAGGSAVAMTGGEVSGGVAINIDRALTTLRSTGNPATAMTDIRMKDVALTGSAGYAAGLNVSSDVYIGFARGDLGDVKGQTLNTNFVGGPLSLSLFLDSSGQLVGATLGWGPGFPFGFSYSSSTTGILPVEDIWAFFTGTSARNSCPRPKD